MPRKVLAHALRYNNWLGVTGAFSGAYKNGGKFRTYYGGSGVLDPQIGKGHAVCACEPARGRCASSRQIGSFFEPEERPAGTTRESLPASCSVSR
jgi:hypothetical protein